MDSEQRDEIQRINARYVEETLAGLHPSLTEYITRYPQYADAIADFVAYFHAVEVEIPQEYDAHSEPLPPSRSALLKTLQRRIIAQHAQNGHQPWMTSLLTNSMQESQDITQLTVVLNISSDIVSELENHLVVFETIPLALQRAMAKYLDYSLEQVQQFLEWPASFYRRTPNVIDEPSRYVAETSPSYLSLQRDFLEIVEASEVLSQEQKQYWREVVAGEKKERDADE